MNRDHQDTNTQGLVPTEYSVPCRSEISYQDLKSPHLQVM